MRRFETGRASVFGGIWLAIVAVTALGPLGAQQKPGRGTEEKPSAHAGGYAYGTSEKYAYILFRGDAPTMLHGSWNATQARLLKGSDKQNRLIVMRDGKPFVITDRETLKAVENALAPVEKLGKQMGDLGRQQGQLGRKQGALGRQQGELGRQMGALGRKQGDLARREATAQGADHSALDAEHRQLEKEQAELARKMETFGKQQEALGRQQEPFARQQKALGKKMEALSKQVDKEITARIDSAFAKGLAQPAPSETR